MKGAVTILEQSRWKKLNTQNYRDYTKGGKKKKGRKVMTAKQMLSVYQNIPGVTPESTMAECH